MIIVKVNQMKIQRKKRNRKPISKYQSKFIFKNLKQNKLNSYFLSSSFKVTEAEVRQLLEHKVLVNKKAKKLQKKLQILNINSTDVYMVCDNLISFK